MRKNFEYDLRKRCFEFSLKTMRFVKRYHNIPNYKRIFDQLIRSATFIVANFIEGGATSSPLEFKRYYEIFLKSANETKYWLEILKNSKEVDQGVVEELLKELTEIINMIAVGMINLKRQDVER